MAENPIAHASSAPGEDAPLAAHPAAPGGEYRPTIRELPVDLRPRERLAYAGAGALSTAELLAIILRVGGKGENVIRMAERLLTQFGGISGLAQAGFDELCRQHGMGEAKTTQIKAALELGRRLMATAPEERTQVRSPADVANLLMSEMGLLEQEQLRVVLLDTKNRILRVATVYSGSLNAAVVRIGEVFREAIRANCASIIVVHNHPSGDPTPSPEDARVTEMLVEAGDLLDIQLLDHVVIGRNGYVSLKERGLGFR
jgi:DNA repair protein RadC